MATFRQEMLDTVERRHCKRHPLTEAWAQGELSKEIQDRVREILPDPVPAGTEDITSTFPAIRD